MLNKIALALSRRMPQIVQADKESWEKTGPPSLFGEQIYKHPDQTVHERPFKTRVFHDGCLTKLNGQVEKGKIEKRKDKDFYVGGAEEAAYHGAHPLQKDPAILFVASDVGLADCRNGFPTCILPHQYSQEDTYVLGAWRINKAWIQHRTDPSLRTPLTQRIVMSTQAALEELNKK